MAHLSTKFVLSARLLRSIALTQRSFRHVMYSAPVATSKVHSISTNGPGFNVCRSFQTSQPRQDDDEEDLEEGEPKKKMKQRFYDYHPSDVDTSIRYMNSEAYETTYKGEHVWVPYRRNHKGRFPPEKTRKTCVRGGQISTGNPCPICRDEYLVLHPKNIELLKQFISPISGDIISYTKTGLCQMQHKALTIAVLQAWDLGYLERPLPFREYNYSNYYPQYAEKSS